MPYASYPNHGRQDDREQRLYRAVQQRRERPDRKQRPFGSIQVQDTPRRDAGRSFSVVYVIVSGIALSCLGFASGYLQRKFVCCTAIFVVKSACLTRCTERVYVEFHVLNHDVQSGNQQHLD